MNTYHSKAHSMRCCRGQVLVILGPGHSQCVLASVLLAPSSTVINDRIYIPLIWGDACPFSLCSHSLSHVHLTSAGSKAQRIETES